MNIFILDSDPEQAARQQCDKHCVKMVCETAQMLCAPFEPGTAPYKRTHYQHPCTVWARASRQNYEWLLRHGKAQAAEYTKRYGRVHKSQAVIEWCAERYRELKLPEVGLTPFAQAMPDVYQRPDPVEAYRLFYVEDKARFAVWNKGTSPPEWWPGV